MVKFIEQLIRRHQAREANPWLVWQDTHEGDWNMIQRIDVVHTKRLLHRNGVQLAAGQELPFRSSQEVSGIGL